MASSSDDVNKSVRTMLLRSRHRSPGCSIASAPSCGFGTTVVAPKKPTSPGSPVHRVHGKRHPSERRGEEIARYLTPPGGHLKATQPVVDGVLIEAVGSAVAGEGICE